MVWNSRRNQPSGASPQVHSGARADRGSMLLTVLAVAVVLVAWLMNRGAGDAVASGGPVPTAITR